MTTRTTSSLGRTRPEAVRGLYDGSEMAGSLRPGHIAATREAHA